VIDLDQALVPHFLPLKHRQTLRIHLLHLPDRGVRRQGRAVRVFLPVGVGETGVLCGGAGEVGRVRRRGGGDGLGGVLGWVG
jgi:hypothetical protein